MSSESRFSKLSYEDFRALAQEQGLSKYERIGFPDSYRQGSEVAIFTDIRQKLTVLDRRNMRVADIGPGCTDLPIMLIELCREQGHRLALLDNAEMLSHLPEESFVEKQAVLFPNCHEWIESHKGKLDAVLCYSVLHYVLVDVPFFRFFDAALSLLAPGGQLLIGDVPNVSRRKRFFASDAGVRFHKEFMKTNTPPVVDYNHIEWDQVDDAILFSLVFRARAQGFDAYVMPQNPLLPMANRREDILVTRP